LKATTLTIIVFGVVACAVAQQTPTEITARHVIGLENIKRNSTGKLTVQNGVMQFRTGAAVTKIPTLAIEDLAIGSETTQAGGKIGTVAKTAAIAAPYDSGAALSLFLRTKVDVLTVSYRDSCGGLHAAILALPKGQAGPLRDQLIAAGARTRSPGERTLKEKKPEAVTTSQGDNEKLSASAIIIEPVETGDVPIPAEFRSAIYEFLVQRVREAGTFQKVFRSGDQAVEGIPDVVTLRTTVIRYKEGSQMEREITTVFGTTNVDVSAWVTAKGGRTLLETRVRGKVRFFGENLGVTNDLAKRISKRLRNAFGS